MLAYFLSVIDALDGTVLITIKYKEQMSMDGEDFGYILKMDGEC